MWMLMVGKAWKVIRWSAYDKNNNKLDTGMIVKVDRPTGMKGKNIHIHIHTHLKVQRRQTEIKPLIKKNEPEIFAETEENS